MADVGGAREGASAKQRRLDSRAGSNESGTRREPRFVIASAVEHLRDRRLVGQLRVSDNIRRWAVRLPYSWLLLAQRASRGGDPQPLARRLRPTRLANPPSRRGALADPSSRRPVRRTKRRPPTPVVGAGCPSQTGRDAGSAVGLEMSTQRSSRSFPANPAVSASVAGVLVPMTRDSRTQRMRLAISSSHGGRRAAGGRSLSTQLRRSAARDGGYQRRRQPRPNVDARDAHARDRSLAPHDEAHLLALACRRATARNEGHRHLHDDRALPLERFAALPTAGSSSSRFVADLTHAAVDQLDRLDAATAEADGAGAGNTHADGRGRVTLIEPGLGGDLEAV